jgi:hypothetical protein
VNRVLAGGALAAFIVVMIAIAIASATSGGGSKPPNVVAPTTVSTVTTAPTTTAVVLKPAAVELTGAGAYDPEGDHHENDDLAPLAVDGNPATFWKTEHYTRGFFKKGVGLLLDAGRHRALARVLVGTDGPGASAEILLGEGPTGPFRPVSPVRPLAGTTAFKLERAAAGRYLVIWITALPQAAGEAHITEVRAFAAGS